MELIKENVEISELRQKGSGVSYIDGDIIVPDVKPDILKILQVDAVSRIDEKEISDGEIKIRGTVKYNILYVPDSEGECIKSIGTEMDFSYTIDKIDTSGGILPKISSDVEKVEFNLINSRKLNIKTAVAVDYILWGKKGIEVSKSMDFDAVEAIYEKVKAQNINVLEESTFSIREKLQIPAGVSGISEILKMDVTISDREVKAITGKAVVRGNISVCILYLDFEKNIHSVDTEIPFTEVIEIFDMEEDSDCDLWYHLGEYDFNLALDDDQETRCIEVDISITAGVTSQSSDEIEIMSDCFCPGKPAKMISDKVTFERMVSKKSMQYNVKDVVTPDGKSPEISSVYNVILRPTVTKTEVENEKVLIEGRCEIYVLYITENSQIPIHCIKKDVPINLKLDDENARAQMVCNAKILPEHMAYNLNMANEVEVRCVLSADINLMEKSEISMISGVEFEENDRECGVIIYFVKSGDTLWDIAKKYSVSVSCIKELNGIEDKNLIMAGDRLIIPVC